MRKKIFLTILLTLTIALIYIHICPASGVRPVPVGGAGGWGNFSALGSVTAVADSSPRKSGVTWQRPNYTPDYPYPYPYPYPYNNYWTYYNMGVYGDLPYHDEVTPTVTVTVTPAKPIQTSFSNPVPVEFEMQGTVTPCGNFFYIKVSNQGKENLYKIFTNENTVIKPAGYSLQLGDRVKVKYTNSNQETIATEVEKI